MIIKLKSVDNEVFDVDENIATKSVTIKTMLENVKESPADANTPIELSSISGNILKQVLKWAEHHKHDPEPESETDEDDDDRAKDLEEWDQQFFKLDDEPIFDIMMAANFLEMKSLLNMAAKAMARTLMGKTAEEIRERFGLENDLKDDKVSVSAAGDKKK